jgi:hypothetical protein
MDIVGIVTSVLVASSASWLGPWAVRELNRAYDKNVDELPAFPIILRPYKWILLLYLVVGLMFWALIVFVAWDVLRRSGSLSIGDNPGWHAIFSLPSLIILLTTLFPAYWYAGQKIVLEPDKLTFCKWGKTRVIDLHDIASHNIIPGYLTVRRKSDGSTVKISLYFQNIRYLNEVLKRWFSQLGQKHHFVYSNQSHGH